MRQLSKSQTLEALPEKEVMPARPTKVGVNEATIKYTYAKTDKLDSNMQATYNRVVRMDHTLQDLTEHFSKEIDNRKEEREQ
jgi:hypothetical protein